MLIQRPQNLTAKIKKTLTAADVRTFQFKILSNKEAEYLSLGLSQVIEKIFTQKLKNEEFEELQSMIRDVYYRGKGINLNEAARLLVGMVENTHWKNHEHETAFYNNGFPKTRNGQGFELEKADTLIPLKKFLNYLIKTKIETKISKEQQTTVLSKLEEIKNTYPYDEELRLSIKILKETMGCAEDEEIPSKTTDSDPLFNESMQKMLETFKTIRGANAGFGSEPPWQEMIDALKKLKEDEK